MPNSFEESGFLGSVAHHTNCALHWHILPATTKSFPAQSERLHQFAFTAKSRYLLSFAFRLCHRARDTGVELEDFASTAKQLTLFAGTYYMQRTAPLFALCGRDDTATGRSFPFHWNKNDELFNSIISCAKHSPSQTIRNENNVNVAKWYNNASVFSFR